MAIVSVSATRVAGADLVDVVSLYYRNHTTDRWWTRPLNYEMFVGTHLPGDQQTIGAIATTIFLAKPNIEKITIWQTDSGAWIAEADIYDMRPHILRGEGNTPANACVSLIFDLYAY